MLGCIFWVSPISVQHISLQPTRSNHTVQSIQNEVPLGAMLGCLFWVSPISVQHISLQPTRSNHTVQSIQNESTPGCYVRLSLLSLQPTRSNHTIQSIQNKSTPGCHVRLYLGHTRNIYLRGFQPTTSDPCCFCTQPQNPQVFVEAITCGLAS